MMIDVSDDEDLDEKTSMKVRVPRHLQVKLHSQRALTGRNISDIVTEVLEDYYDGKELGLND